MSYRFILSLSTLVLLTPFGAFASTFTCTTQGISELIAGNRSTDSAHLLDTNACNPSNVCGSSRAYIEFADKELFAQALAAKVNGYNVNIQVDDGATSKGSATHGTTNCKVISLWY